MNVGLPGTGLGGLFYFFSVILMFLIEIYLTLRGRSNFKRWRFVSKNLALMACMVGVLYGALWLVRLFLGASGATVNSQAHSYNLLFTNSMLITVSILITLIVGINLVGFILKRR